MKPAARQIREPKARDLPQLMDELGNPDPRCVPLMQFIADWNRSPDPAAMILDDPVYDGPDDLILPYIAAVVHALADRDGVLIPAWVFQYRAHHDVILFGWDPNGTYGRWVRGRSVPASAHHRVWFPPETLDKGKPWTLSS